MPDSSVTFSMSGTQTPSVDLVDAVDRQLALLFRRTRAVMIAAASHLDEHLGSHAYGIVVRLAELEEAEIPARVTELATYFVVGKPTISRQVSSLEAHGLVTKTPDHHDGRAALVRLTPSGRERLEETRTARRAWLQRALENWSNSDLSDAVTLLARLNESQDLR
ncbi:MarR family transcriptional regulator [Micrococcales bacterium 31B]|nr:MarR family transcriptional regulator [Micrococcales bacterium 31B]